jgi:MraZ protein
MFLGKYQFFINDDHSLVIPPAFRPLLAQGIYITRGFEQNLMIMSEKVFQERYQQVASLNMADPLVRLLNRLILGNACSLEVGEDGHLVIPPDLASFAGLEKEIVLVGQGDYVEAWSPSNWEKQSSLLQDVEANSQRFAQLDLTMV